MTTAFTNPIHLYRSLLRECTYLFDSNARTYFRQYISSSFRAQALDLKSKTTKHKINQERLPCLDERHQLKRGRKLLSTLLRANQGYRKPLQNVLKRAYGRKGRRRRDLMAEIMLKESTENTTASVNYSNGSSAQHQQLPVKRFQKGWRPPPKFDALMRSQAVLQGYLDHGAKIKTKPPIPEENAWGKPMPDCRIKNKTKQWYAKNAQILLPHLSEKEFDEILERSLGKYLTIPARRPTGKGIVFAVEEGGERQETSAGMTNFIVSGPLKHKSLRQRRLEGNPHNLSRRFLSRMYARTILKHTPVAMARPDGLGVMYRWNSGQRKFLESVELADDHRTSALFDLIDNSEPEEIRT